MKYYKKKRIKKFSIVKNKKSHEIETLEKIQQQISLNVDSFLVLSEEGDPTQVALAFQRAKSEFLKLGPKMVSIATKFGGELPDFVEDFIESVDTILHGQGMLDEDLITHCVDSTARLKAELLREHPCAPEFSGPKLGRQTPKRR